MPLNAPNATVKPGRVPDNERASLQTLLTGNGFTNVDYRKAVSADQHEADLNTRFDEVIAIEQQFEGGNVNPQKRRALRLELEPAYDYLLDAAQKYVDDANTAYRTALEAIVLQLRGEFPDKDEMFMSVFGKRSATITLDARLAKWAQLSDYLADIRERYKAKYKLGNVPVSTLTVPEQQAFDAEKATITTQLNNWANLPDNAVGCNDIGTWGTSAAGAGNAFQVSTVSKKVFAALVEWWRGKDNTYVTLSDTSSRSLKKTRNVNDGRSRTINYHINVA
jgi:hypothetical protein